MSTRLALVGPLLAGGAVIRNAIRALFEVPDQPVDPVQARMELARITATHDGRRAALTLARHNHPEQP